MIIRISFTAFGMRVIKALLSWTTWWSSFDSFHWRCWHCEAHRGFPHKPDIELSTTDVYKLSVAIDMLELKLDALVMSNVLFFMLLFDLTTLGVYDVYATYEGECVVSYALYARGLCHAVRFI